MASKRLDKANDLLIQGKVKKAIKLCDKVLSSKPDNCEALALKGDCLMCANDFKKALKYYDKALAINPNLIRIYFNKAEMYIHGMEFDKAYDCSVEILDRDSTNADAWFLKGRSLFFMSNSDEALLCFDECLKLDSNNYKSLAHKGIIFNDRGKFKKARKYLEKAFLIKEDDMDVLIGLAMNYYRSENYEKAMEYANRLFAIDIHNFVAFYVSVFSLAALKEFEECLKVLNIALKIYPDEKSFLDIKNFFNSLE